jgi:hypothetical protein
MFASESPGPSADNDRCEQQEDADEREHAAKDGPQAEVRDMIVQQGNVHQPVKAQEKERTPERHESFHPGLPCIELTLASPGRYRRRRAT